MDVFEKPLWVMRLSQWHYLGKFIDDYDKKKIFSVIISNITQLEDIPGNTIFYYVRQCELLIENRGQMRVYKPLWSNLRRSNEKGQLCRLFS